MAESKRIAVGWLKMAVEAKRAVVPVDILFWRLMAPKSWLCGRSWCHTLTFVNFACI